MAASAGHREETVDDITKIVRVGRGRDLVLAFKNETIIDPHSNWLGLSVARVNGDKEGLTLNMPVRGRASNPANGMHGGNITAALTRAAELAITDKLPKASMFVMPTHVSARFVNPVFSDAGLLKIETELVEIPKTGDCVAESRMFGADHKLLASLNLRARLIRDRNYPMAFAAVQENFSSSVPLLRGVDEYTASAFREFGRKSISGHDFVKKALPEKSLVRVPAVVNAGLEFVKVSKPDDKIQGVELTALPPPFYAGTNGMLNPAFYFLALDTSVGCAGFLGDAITNADLEVDVLEAGQSFPLGESVVVTGRIDHTRGRNVYTSGEVRSESGDILARARSTCRVLAPVP